MATQPQFPNPGRQAPARSRRRVADHPAAPSPSSRRPRRTCPEPVEGGPSSNQHPRPTAVPRQSAPPNPPSPRLPTRPSHLVRTAPSTDPNWPNSAPPRPQEFFGKNSYARTAPPVIPASSAGTQRQPASQGLRATPSIPRPQPHRLVRPAQLTDHPSVPPDAEDSPIRRKNRLKLSLASRSPLGTGWPEIAPPFSPSPPAPPRPTVTLTSRSPKAREGFANGRRNHRSRG